MRTKHTDAPGSPAWHARRAACFNAGDASAMLCCHPSGKTRTELLHEIHTGLQREFSDYVQERVIDPGHVIEAAMRPIAEEILDEELEVPSYTLAVEGLSRPLGASLDGAEFMGGTNWECKRANEALRAALPHTGRDSHTRNDARQLPKGYRVQLEQQLMASPAKRTLFSVGDVDSDGKVTEERHAVYTPDPDLRAEILAGWRVFDVDLAAYVPPSAAAIEKIVAEPVEDFPTPAAHVTGEIALKDNFQVFEERLRLFLENKLIREPKSDQDFADLDEQIKAMRRARESLKAAGAQMLAQVEPVQAATAKQKMLDDLLQKNLSMAERMLKDEKERRRGEIVAGGVGALKAHIDALNTRLGKPFMPAVAADFGGVVKGLKSLASMEVKVDAELARCKIVANEVADKIQANLTYLLEDVPQGHAFLFADLQALVQKSPDDFRAVVDNRIAAHKAKREKEEAEQRERIRAEEEAKARAKVAQEQREQQEREAAERRQREEQEAAARREREQAEAQQRQQEQAATAPATVAAPAPTPTPAPAVIAMPTRAAAPAADTGARVSLGQINARIAPLSITVAGLLQIGFPHVGKDKAAFLFRESDLQAIRDALIRHLEQIPLAQAA